MDQPRILSAEMTTYSAYRVSAAVELRLAADLGHVVPVVRV